MNGSQVADNSKQRLEELRLEHPRLYRAVMFTMERHIKAVVRILGAFYVTSALAIVVLLPLSTVVGLYFLGFAMFITGTIFAFSRYIAWYLGRPTPNDRV